MAVTFYFGDIRTASLLPFTKRTDLNKTFKKKRKKKKKRPLGTNQLIFDLLKHVLFMSSALKGYLRILERRSLGSDLIGRSCVNLIVRSQSVSNSNNFSPRMHLNDEQEALDQLSLLIRGIGIEAFVCLFVCWI